MPPCKHVKLIRILGNASLFKAFAGQCELYENIQFDNAFWCIFFLPLGAQQAEDPRIQWRKKRETMLCDYLAVAQSDLLVWMLLLVFYHAQLRECQNILIINISVLYLSVHSFRCISYQERFLCSLFSLFQMWSPPYKLNTQRNRSILWRKH